MNLDAVTLEGRFVRLEPLALTHLDALSAVGLDPDLWKWTTTSLRTPEDMRVYVQSAIDDRAAGRALPFATIERATGTAIGCTRFANISIPDNVQLLGKKVYASLKEVPFPIDMVEIFRNSEAAGPITDEALALEPLPKVLWMQLSVRNDEAAAKAEAKGLKVVMDRCPKIEFGRLSGEISWQGVNSRMLSSKKPVLSGKGFQKLSLNRP